MKSLALERFPGVVDRGPGHFKHGENSRLVREFLPKQTLYDS
jgi:hypothetical protein